MAARAVQEMQADNAPAHWLKRWETFCHDAQKFGACRWR
jgi:hypothetical protein